MGKTLEECYEILGLEYGANEDEIKSAYRKKALKCHPDKNPDDPLSTQKFQELGHAYRRLTGEEDSDDDDYDDDDMDIWRDFFFFLFRDEILARVRCKCSRCERAGEQEDDDFLATLAKEQEEQYKFTEEEMSQFTCFANLKEQREANKKKFCDERNQSNIKPEQKATKGHKPKVKSNKQLKVEQWKREKEISEMAAQISQTNPKLPGKKAASKDAKTMDPHQQKSCYQHVVADRKKDAKEAPENSVNKRNARKKKNRNKSKQHGGKEETESSQNNIFAKTTLAEQKVASSFVVQDAMRNVTIKPETTKRQDDVTGRLPRYTRYTSPRMVKAQARVQDSTMSRQTNVLPEQTARGWFDNQKPGTASRASYGTNIWQKRQEKQQFLAELQPSSQTDEELQLQLALELSKKQAEIDAQQREINLLEKQMEETVQIEKKFQQITSMEETLNTAAAAVTDPGRFTTAGIPHGCESAVNEVEEWGVASDNEHEWQESEQVSNISDEDASNDEENSFTIDEAYEPQHKIEKPDLDEKHLAEGFVSSGNVSLTVPKSNEQLSQLSRGQNSQDCCPYGKNCCLGKHCLYTHPQSIDDRKSQKCADNTYSSNEKCDRLSSERAYSPTEKDYSHVIFAEAPDPSDLSYTVDKPGQSCNALISNHKDASTTNESLNAVQTGSSVDQVPEAEDTSTTEQFIHAGDSVPFGHVGGAGLSKDSYQCGLASGKHQDLTQSSLDNKPSLASPPEDRYLSSQEKSKTTNSSNVQIHSRDHLIDLNADPGKGDGGGSTVVCENPVTGKASTANSDVKGPTVYVIADQSQFPLGFPAASIVKQSVASLPPLVNLSAGAKLQNVLQTSQHSSSLPVSYAGQMPTGLPANLGAKTLTAIPQISTPVVTVPRTLSSAAQNSASPSCSETLEAPATTQQPISAMSSTLSQEGVTNGFPAIPGFPFLPFGNVFPFLNPANAAANASLMTAGGGGGSGIPFPIMPGTSNFMPNQQGGQFVPPYLNMVPGSGVSPLGQYLPLQAQLSNLPEMTMEGNVPRPPPPPQPQPSQAVVANNHQSAAPTVQQPVRFPFPFIDPQAFVNMNAAMALGIPYSVLQNGCQTSLQSGTAPQLQGLNKTTDPGKVLHTGVGTTKPVEVKPDIGLERGESVSCRSKTPSLRRPATVPKVIQHQASKSS